MSRWGRRKGGKGSNQYESKPGSPEKDDQIGEAIRDFSRRMPELSGSSGSPISHFDQYRDEGDEGGRDLLVNSVLSGDIDISDVSSELLGKYHPAYVTAVGRFVERSESGDVDLNDYSSLSRASDPDELERVILSSKDDQHSEMSRLSARYAALDTAVKMNPGGNNSEYLAEMKVLSDRTSEVRIGEIGI